MREIFTEESFRIGLDSDWFYVLKHYEVPENILNKYIKDIPADTLWIYQNLSEEFIKDNILYLREYYNLYFVNQNVNKDFVNKNYGIVFPPYKDGFESAYTKYWKRYGCTYDMEINNFFTHNYKLIIKSNGYKRNVCTKCFLEGAHMFDTTCEESVMQKVLC